MKSFLCGRLMQTNDGILKKIDLEDGGGTRRCHLEQNGLLFETVKKRLMKIYHLSIATKIVRFKFFLIIV